jgi:hypothetical protein
MRLEEEDDDHAILRDGENIHSAGTYQRRDDVQTSLFVAADASLYGRESLIDLFRIL